MDQIRNDTEKAFAELLAGAKLRPGDIVVVGCSSSEILGKRIGSVGSLDAAAAVYEGLAPLREKHGLFLAAQCCEHLNRAIVIERDAAPGCEYVNVVPQKKAGGSLATIAYKSFSNPVVVESIKADAGIDIGNTLIGMHLKAVAVPVRISFDKIGKANIVCARTRPKFIGGIRAVYDQDLL